MKRQWLVTLHYYSHSPQEHHTRGLSAHIVAMSHPYITLPSHIFTSFHLKYAIPRWPKITLITHGYNFIETNFGKHNLTKLTINQVTQELKHPQCDPIIQDSFSFIFIFAYGPKSNLQLSMQLHFTSNTMANLKSIIATLQTNLHSLWLSESMGIGFDMRFWRQWEQWLKLMN